MLHHLPPQIQFQYRVVSLCISFIRLWQLCPETFLFFHLSVLQKSQKTPQGKLKNQLTSFWPQRKNSYPHCDDVSDTYQKKDDGVWHVRSKVNLQICGGVSGGCVAVRVVVARWTAHMWPIRSVEYNLRCYLHSANTLLHGLLKKFKKAGQSIAALLLVRASLARCCCLQAPSASSELIYFPSLFYYFF